MDPILATFGIAALALLAAGGVTVVAAHLAIRRYLPRDLQSLAQVREVFVYYVFQPEIPMSVRRIYVTGLGLMTSAPFVGLIGAIVASRDDLLWPLAALCAFASLATFTILRRGFRQRGPIR